MNKILQIAVVLSIISSFSSCTRGFEELNKTPIATSDVPAATILTYVERSACGNLFDVLNIANNTDAYSNHMAQLMNTWENAYNEQPQVINMRWLNIMSFQINLNKIITKCTTTGTENPSMVGVSRTLSAFLWLIMTDTWGAIPYAQGAKGEEGILQPEYDNQQTVYTGLLAQLDEANSLLASGQGTIEGDVIFGNDRGLWQKFTNSLRMRIAIRMSDVDQITAAEVLTFILDNPSTYPVMESNGDNASFTWLETNWREPFADSKIKGDLDNYGMCDVSINALLHTKDPRIGEFAHPAESDGQYRGIATGISPSDLPPQNSISRIGYRYRDNFAGKTYLMRYPEVCFIKAEAYLRGLAPGGVAAAKEAYVEGITASFAEHDVAPESITGYMSDANVEWDATGDWGYTNLQKIYYQKWVSLFKEGHEAWAETRRTDIPQLSAATSSPYPGHTRPPLRWPYPVSEYNLNNAEVKKWDSGTVDQFWGEKMWWDTRGEEAH
jgi:hypothetical protein